MHRHKQCSIWFFSFWWPLGNLISLSQERGSHFGIPNFLIFLGYDLLRNKETFIMTFKMIAVCGKISIPPPRRALKFLLLQPSPLWNFLWKQWSNDPKRFRNVYDFSVGVAPPLPGKHAFHKKVTKIIHLILGAVWHFAELRNWTKCDWSQKGFFFYSRCFLVS